MSEFVRLLLLIVLGGVGGVFLIILFAAILIGPRAVWDELRHPQRTGGGEARP